MATSNGGKFRSKRTNFTMVSNSALLDVNLSTRAKGLYCIIQHYITIDGFTLYKSYLQKQCKESHNIFDSMWKELKEAGYLIQYKLRDVETNRYYYEYELLDTPQPNFPDMEKPGDGKARCGNMGAINNKDLNNTLLNNTVQKEQDRHQRKPSNNFHNFEQRTYNYDDLEERLLENQRLRNMRT